MLRLEARPQASRLMSLASPVLALAVTVLIGVALFMLLGKDPLRGLQVFCCGAHRETKRRARDEQVEEKE